MRGFTIIEILVSVMIFSIVMTVALGSLLAMSESDRRAEALKSVINNLNFALDSMSRSMRTGYSYHCGNSGDLTTPSPNDCATSGTAQPYMAYLAANGNKVAYCLSGGAIRRQIVSSGALDSNCANLSAITSPEVTVTRLQFIVNGATGTTIQPKVTILISGTVRVSGNSTTAFNLQTSVTQRIYDQ